MAIWVEGYGMPRRCVAAGCRGKLAEVWLVCWVVSGLPGSLEALQQVQTEASSLAFSSGDGVSEVRRSIMARAAADWRRCGA